PADSGGFF
ncbi:hypothetical protein VCHC72A2_00648B, partial [Vibrio cholerae HC-72A2]